MSFKLCAALLTSALLLISRLEAFAQEQVEDPRPPTYSEEPRGPRPPTSGEQETESQPSGSNEQVTAPQPSVVAAEQTPEPLTQERLKVLVARIALYPDDLVAVISAASLYPLQIVEAARYLENKETKPDLKPKEGWDGSVVALLNYPEILRMMSDDLDWTQALGEALTYQQKDVLVAIQDLREEAVAKGVIKTDEKIKVVEEADKIAIEPASPETVYVPRYEPEMLYEPGYDLAPIGYYPDPYAHYYYPTAPFFPGFVTGVIWVAVVDWDDWGIWFGDWDDDVDIHIDCHHCFKGRDFDGKMKWNEVDWKDVDRKRIRFDKNQLTRIDRKQLESSLKTNERNYLKNRAAELKKTRASALTDQTSKARDTSRRDIRKDVAEALKSTDRRRKPAELREIEGDQKAESKRAAKADTGYQRDEKIRTVRKSKRAVKADTANQRDEKIRPARKSKRAAKANDHRLKKQAWRGKEKRSKKLRIASSRLSKGIRGLEGGKKGRKKRSGSQRCSKKGKCR
jgi:hypothetical protein